MLWSRPWCKRDGDAKWRWRWWAYNWGSVQFEMSSGCWKLCEMLRRLWFLRDGLWWKFMMWTAEKASRSFTRRWRLVLVIGEIRNWWKAYWNFQKSIKALKSLLKLTSMKSFLKSFRKLPEHDFSIHWMMIIEKTSRLQKVNNSFAW